MSESWGTPVNDKDRVAKRLAELQRRAERKGSKRTQDAVRSFRNFTRSKGVRSTHKR